jgi:carbonic anhydrase
MNKKTNIFEFEIARASITQANALEQLKAGNTRFATGRAVAHTWQREKVVKTGEYGQAPQIGVLSCADSRVPVEMLFDMGVGDLFIVRIAGNFDTAEGSATFEYGTKVLGVHTILVLGHTKCGAVEATLAGKPVPGNIAVLAKALSTGIKKFIGMVKDNSKNEVTPEILNEAIETNVRYQMIELLNNSKLLASLEKDGKLQILGGIYDVETGIVRFLA